MHRQWWLLVSSSQLLLDRDEGIAVLPPSRTGKSSWTAAVSCSCTPAQLLPTAQQQRHSQLPHLALPCWAISHPLPWSSLNSSTNQSTVICSATLFQLSVLQRSIETSLLEVFCKIQHLFKKTKGFLLETIAKTSKKTIHQLFPGQQDTSCGATPGALTSEGIQTPAATTPTATSGWHCIKLAVFHGGTEKNPYFSSVGFISKSWKKLEQHWGQTALHYCVKTEQQLLASSHARVRCFSRPWALLQGQRDTAFPDTNSHHSCTLPTLCRLYHFLSWCE